MNSEIIFLKNNYDKCAQFLGTFLFCSLIGVFTGDVLKYVSIRSLLISEIKSKLMTYDEYARVWNLIAKFSSKKS